MADRMRRGAWVVLLACPVFLIASRASAESDAVDRGVAYLVSAQNPDGSWSADGRQTVDTVEAFKALVVLSRGADALGRSLPFLGAIPETDADKVARKLTVLVHTTGDTSGLISKLLDLQNPDGGWGLREKKQSDVEDTLLAVDALLRAEVENVTVYGKARDLLIAEQEENGSWILADEETPSAISRTALALLALKGIERAGAGSAELTTAAAKAQAFLEAQPTIGETADRALVYTALLTIKQPAELQGILTSLMDAQRADGSWEGEAFTTALVLQALQAVQPPEPGDLPNLFLRTEGITFNPATPLSGQQVTLGATVFNDGAADAGDVVVEFFNGDPRLGGTAIESPQTITSIPAGGSAIASVELDTTELIGPQLIVVFADRANVIRETDETDNAAAKGLIVAGRPDLEITASDISCSPATPEAFEQVEIVAKVRNVGAGVAENIVVRFLDGTTKIADLTLGGIGVDQAGTATVTTGLTEGAHTITVQVDPDNLIESEENKANNEASVTITVGALQPGLPDLVVESVTADPAAPIANETVEIAVTLVNRGGDAAGASFEVLLEKDTTTLHTFPVPDLASGQNLILTHQTSFAAGSYAIKATADSGGVITESDEANNVGTLGLVVPSAATPPDLAFTRFEVIPAAPVAGDPVQIVAEVENRGTTTAQGVVVRIVENTTQIGPDFAIQSLTGGQRGVVQFETSFTAGTKTLVAKVDPENTVAESDETNNEATTVVAVVSVARPDLQIIADNIDFSNESPLPGETVQVTATVQNVGEEPSGGFEVLFTSGDPFAGGAILIGKVTSPGIPSGGTGQVTADFQVPRGSHEVFVLADSAFAVAESNEKNNLASRSIETAPLPDLAVEANSLVVSHTDLDEARAVKIQARIDNLGSVPATDVLVQFGERQNSDIFLISGRTVASVPAGGSVAVEALWQPSPGTHTLVVVVDGNDTIPEMDETNNAAEKEEHFTVSEPVIRLYRVDDEPPVEAYQFDPYEMVRISVEIFIENTTTLVSVVRPDGESFKALPEDGTFFFNTGSLAAGNYTVEAEVVDNETGVALQTAERSFEILPLFKLGTAAVRAGPTFVRLDAPEPVQLTLLVQNPSNIPGQGNAHLAILDPNGDEAAALDVALSFIPGEQLLQDLGLFDTVFILEGDYAITVTVTVEGQDPLVAGKMFPVVPEVRLDVDKTITPSVLAPAGQGEVQVQINVTGVGTPLQAKPIDFMFIMDRSGSMGWEGKIQAAREAAITFTDLLNPDHRAGVVPFKNTASLAQELTFDKEQVKSVLATIPATGGTNVGAGIEVTRTHYNDVSPPERRRVALLLTDGVTTSESYALNQAALAGAEGVIIFTIGLGTDADHDLLQEIADLTGGTYYYSPGSGDLEAIFVAVYDKVVNLAASDITITDRIALTDGVLQTESIQPGPDSVVLEDTRAVVSWSRDTIIINSTSNFGFTLTLLDLKPGEERLVNEGLTVTFTDPLTSNVETVELPEQYVTVSEPFVLGITADKAAYLPPEDAVLTTTVTSRRFLSQQLHTQRSDFEAGTLDGVDASSRPGSLILEKDASGAFLPEGTIRLVTDGGEPARWSEIVLKGSSLSGLLDQVAVRSRSAPTLETLGAAEFTQVTGISVVSKQRSASSLSGLIGYWPGDGDAEDVVGGHDGTMHGGLVFGPGRIGQAFQFDGVDDYVLAHFPDRMLPEYSVSLWVKASVVGQSASRCAFTNYNNFGVGGTFDSLQIDVDGGNPGSYRAFTWGAYKMYFTSVTTDWQHLVVTYDGYTMRAYKNGQLTDTLGQIPGFAGDYFRDVQLGRNRAGYKYFAGLVDDVGVFYRALEAGEISLIHQQGLKGKSLGEIAFSRHIAAYWSGDGNAVDTIGGNNGTLQGATTFNGGRVDQAFRFSGADAAVLVPDSPGLHSDQELTVAGWFFADNTDPGWQGIFWKGNTPDGGETGHSNQEYTLWLHKNRYLYLSSTPENRIGIGNRVAITPQDLVKVGEWHHFAGVISSDFQFMKIYLDGIERAHSDYDPGGIRDTTGPFVLGNRAGPVDRPLSGLVDEVAIFHTRLSAGDIREVRQAGLDKIGLDELFLSRFTLSGDIISSPSRYLEIELTLKTADPLTSPVIESVAVGYNDRKLAIDVEVEDPDGEKVVDVARIPLLDNDMGEERSWDRIFETDGVAPGAYVARANLVDVVAEEVLATATDGFDVLAQTADQVLDGSIATDRRRYAANETAVLVSKVRNDSNNLTVGSLGVAVAVVDPEGGDLETFNYAIVNLLSGVLDVKRLEFAVGVLPPGTYTVKQTVTVSGQAVFTREATFEVVASVEVGRGIAGTISIDPAVVQRGKSVGIDITARNTGNVALTGVTLTVEVVDPDMLEILKTFTEQTDLPVGEEVEFHIDYERVQLEEKSYPVAYRATVVVDGESVVIPLDMGGFTVVRGGPRLLKESLLAELAGLASCEHKKVNTRLAQALAHLRSSLNIDPNAPDQPWKDFPLWRDDEYLDLVHGQLVMDQEKDAALKLSALVKENLCEEHVTKAQAMIAELVAIDREIATLQIDESEAAPAAPGKEDQVAKFLEKARENVAAGDAADAAGDPEKAILRYRDAWNKAVQALRLGGE